MNSGIEKMVAEGRLDRQLALVREHWGAVRRLWLAPGPLKVARLGPDLPRDFWMTAGMPGLATVMPGRGDRFEFADNGKPAVIVPAYDGLPGLLDVNPERHVEELRDLVAVDLDRPDRFWRRRGQAVILGNAYLEIAGQEDEPVPVFKTPLSWLRSGGAGVCILDWAWTRDLLRDRELIAEDLDLGDRLAAALKPEIWIRRAAA